MRACIDDLKPCRGSRVVVVGLFGVLGLLGSQRKLTTSTMPTAPNHLQDLNQDGILQKEEYVSWKIFGMRFRCLRILGVLGVHRRG